jgi:uncharacterized protein YndB with AHSA1/START domain
MLSNMNDAIGTLGLTTRSVSTVELDGRPARRTLLSRAFATGATDLWDALTNPDRIPRWFLPITGELGVGGSYQLQGNAGGTIEECEPPRRFRVTWVYGEAPATWLTVTLHPEGPSSRLDVEHVGPVPEELWAQFGPSATGIGWDLALHGLALHLDTGASGDPAAIAAWTASPDGVAFIEGSALAWQAADVADGTSPEDASARARRSVAFYTGHPETSQN